MRILEQRSRFILSFVLGLALLGGALAADFVLVEPGAGVYYTLAAAAGEGVAVEGRARITGNVHSNRDVDLKTGSAVTGNVSASGKVTRRGSVSGTVTEGAPRFALPTIPSESELRALADRVLEGDQVLKADLIVNDVLLIDGHAHFKGDLNGTGTVIATGDIRIDSLPGKRKPALAAGTRLSLISGNDVRLGAGRSFRGIARAARDIDVEGGARFEGSAVAGRRIQVKADAEVRFLRVVDNRPPALAIVTPNQPVYVDPTIAQPVPAVTLSYSDDSGVNVASLRVFLDDLRDAAPAISLACAAGPASATCPVPIPSESQFEVRATIADLQGNAAAASFRYSIDFSRDTAPPAVSITSPAEGAFVRGPLVEVTGTLVEDTAKVMVVVNNQRATLTGSQYTGTVDLRGSQGTHILQVQAVDGVGQKSPVVERRVTVDSVPPTLTRTAPANGAIVAETSVTVTGKAYDTHGVTVTVNGAPAAVAGGTFTVSLPLAEGRNPVRLVARDPAGNEVQEEIEILRYTPPRVAIAAPGPLTLVSATTIDVAGTVDEPVASVTVDGVPALVAGTSFNAAGAPLQEGSNVVTVVATDATGTVGTATVQVFRDRTAPQLAIAWPAEGATVHRPEVTVTGSVQDVTVALDVAAPAVRVNGADVPVANGGFAASGIPLQPGANVISVVARDAAGNTVTRQRTVIYEPRSGGIAPVSGDLQSGRVGRELPAPLVVEVRDAAGQPVPGVPVVFRVTESDGRLRSGAAAGRGIAANTDAQGRASAFWTLGSRAGSGRQRVEASATGYAGRIAFVASGLPGPPARLHLDSGNYQFGVTGRPLPSPFAVVVTDDLDNLLPGVSVAFRTLKGGGNFGGLPALTLTTADDGRAAAFFTLGPNEGRDGEVAVAELAGTGDSPAVFYATSMRTGDPALTSVSGVVLDNSDVPLAGVTVRVLDTALTARTDAQGRFAIPGAPVGHIHLILDGSTAERPGSWPSLEFELVTIAGRDNGVERPIYLLPLDLDHGLFVDETRGGTLTLPDVPGFALTVEPGSVSFPDGRRNGVISVTPVHGDKVPMVPNNGQQPRLTVTIQPPGARFDPPARITLPNVEGLPPGAQTQIVSFLHDQGQFMPIGTATVSEDGSVVTSDPGFGIVAGGWHYQPQPPQPRSPEGGACGNCPECQGCFNGTCAATSGTGGCDDGEFCTQNDRCFAGNCAGTPKPEKILPGITVNKTEFESDVGGAAKALAVAGCELTEPEWTGSVSLERKEICCEDLDTTKNRWEGSGAIGFTGLGFECLVPGASVNAGIFKAGLKLGVEWGGEVGFSGGSDPCNEGCDKEFSITASMTGTVQLFMEFVSEDVLNVAAGGSYGGEFSIAKGCDSTEISGTAGPVTVFATATIFGFIDVTVEEEVAGTRKEI